MNKVIGLLLVAAVAISGLFLNSGCRKKGCTNPNACNYNAAAKEDDGTCDFTSCNKTGNISFYTPNLAVHGGFVKVTINGKQSTITVNYTAEPPNCLSTNGCAFFNLEAGTYTYTTVDYFGFTSTGSVAVEANSCNKYYIE